MNRIERDIRCGLVLLALLAPLGRPGAAAAGSNPFTARAGLELAVEAAAAWADDARLIYVENDEELTEAGSAPRWGYLFHSKALGRSRGYSLREGKIVDATDLGFEFDAPPLPDGWIDSGEALRRAEERAVDFRRSEGGRLGAMLLVRGLFHQDEPDAPTWAVVYTAPRAPALYVVIDARSGKVVRTWRG